MKLRYKVTFEFDARPPVTTEGVVRAGRVHTCAHRAIQQAQETLRPIGWTSMVFVVLERESDIRQDDGLDHPHPVDVAILGGDPSL